MTDRARRAVGRRDPIAEADHSAFEKRRVSSTIVAHPVMVPAVTETVNTSDPPQPAHGRVNLGSASRAIHTVHPVAGQRRRLDHLQIA